jgi:hypothetical protein
MDFKMMAEAVQPPYEHVTVVRVEGAIIHRERGFAEPDEYCRAIMNVNAQAGYPGYANILMDLTAITIADERGFARFTSQARTMVSAYKNGQFAILAQQPWLLELLEDRGFEVHQDRDLALRAFGPLRPPEKWNRPLFIGPGY